MLSHDIKNVYLEIGTPFTIVRDVNITGEFLDFNNAPEACFSYDTSVVSGDVIVLADNSKFLIGNVRSEYFEGNTIEKKGSIFLTNVSGILKRLSMVRDASTYKQTSAWAVIKNPAYGVMNPSLSDMPVSEYGKSEVTENTLMLQTAVGAELSDRYYVSDTEYYEIIGVKRRLYDGIDLVTLKSDNR